MLTEITKAANSQPYNRTVFSIEGVGGTDGRGGRVVPVARFLIAPGERIVALRVEMEVARRCPLRLARAPHT